MASARQVIVGVLVLAVLGLAVYASLTWRSVEDNAWLNLKTVPAPSEAYRLLRSISVERSYHDPETGALIAVLRYSYKVLESNETHLVSVITVSGGNRSGRYLVALNSSTFEVVYTNASSIYVLHDALATVLYPLLAAHSLVEAVEKGLSYSSRSLGVVSLGDVRVRAWGVELSEGLTGELGVLTRVVVGDVKGYAIVLGVLIASPQEYMMELKVLEVEVGEA